MAVFRHAGLNGLNPRFHHKDELMTIGYKIHIILYIRELRHQQILSGRLKISDAFV